MRAIKSGREKTVFNAGSIRCVGNVFRSDPHG
jgi:hypothetical protein